MKEMQTFIAFLAAQQNPWIFGATVAVMLVFLWKVLREISNMTFSTSEKRLAVLLSYVDQGVEEKHPFSVEQAFRQKFARLLTYNEIVYLLSFESPSTAIRDYLRGAAHISFDDVKKQAVQKRKVNLSLRMKGLAAMFILSMIVTYASAVAMFVFSDRRSSPEFAYSGVFFIFAVVLTLQALLGAWGMKAALSFMGLKRVKVHL